MREETVETSPANNDEFVELGTVTESTKGPADGWTWDGGVGYWN
jgi:hypothetical protein